MCTPHVTLVQGCDADILQLDVMNLIDKTDVAPGAAAATADDSECSDCDD